MSQNIIQLPNRFCFKCSHEEDSAQNVCSRCGGRMKTKTQVRVLGFILTLISAFLLVFMSFITFSVYNMMQEAGKPGITARFTGSQDDAIMIFGLFGFILLFAIVGLGAGLWQLILGKRNKMLVYIMLGIGVVLYIGGFAIKHYLGKS